MAGLVILHMFEKVQRRRPPPRPCRAGSGAALPTQQLSIGEAVEERFRRLGKVRDSHSVYILYSVSLFMQSINVVLVVHVVRLNNTQAARTCQ